MYVIVQLGSHQYKVSEGDIIDAEKIDAKEDKSIKFSSPSWKMVNYIFQVPKESSKIELLCVNESQGQVFFDALSLNASTKKYKENSPLLTVIPYNPQRSEGALVWPKEKFKFNIYARAAVSSNQISPASTTTPSSAAFPRSSSKL